MSACFLTAVIIISACITFRCFWGGVRQEVEASSLLVLPGQQGLVWHTGRQQGFLTASLPAHKKAAQLPCWFSLAKVWGLPRLLAVSPLSKGPLPTHGVQRLCCFLALSPHLAGLLPWFFFYFCWIPELSLSKASSLSSDPHCVHGTHLSPPSLPHIPGSAHQNLKRFFLCSSSLHFPRSPPQPEVLKSRDVLFTRAVNNYIRQHLK